VGANGDAPLAGETLAAAVSAESAVERNGENGIPEQAAEAQPEVDVRAPIPAPPEKPSEAE